MIPTMYHLGRVHLQETPMVAALDGMAEAAEVAVAEAEVTVELEDSHLMLAIMSHNSISMRLVLIRPIMELVPITEWPNALLFVVE